MEAELPTEIDELDALKMENFALRERIFVTERDTFFAKLREQYKLEPNDRINGRAIMRAASLEAV